MNQYLNAIKKISALLGEPHNKMCINSGYGKAMLLLEI